MKLPQFFQSPEAAKIRQLEAQLEGLRSLLAQVQRENIALKHTGRETRHHLVTLQKFIEELGIVVPKETMRFLAGESHPPQIQAARRSELIYRQGRE